jgi:phage baseplate assembly protein W
MTIKNDTFGQTGLRDITVKIPLEINSTNVGYKTLNEEDISKVINYNLKSILLTHKGELMDTNFGVGLRGYLFEPTVNLNAIKFSIEGQISIYMPWLTQVSVIVSSGDEGQSVFVTIKYKLNQPEIIDQFELSLSLDQL